MAVVVEVFLFSDQETVVVDITLVIAVRVLVLVCVKGVEGSIRDRVT